MIIDNLLAFDKVGHVREGDQVNLLDLRQLYGPNIRGTNMYWGFEAPNLDLPAGQGLDGTKMQFIRDFTAGLGVGEIGTIDLCLEPHGDHRSSESFAHVDAHLGKVRDLASDLVSLQSEAALEDKGLRFVIRFASEMNPEPNNAWSGFPDDFQRSWVNVWNAIKGVSHDLLMNFAPGIELETRTDGNDFHAIKMYWPGDDLVDIVGCTWYAGSGHAINPAKERLDEYFQFFSDKGLPYCVSELGGTCDKALKLRSTQVVQSMFRHLLNFDSDQHLSHATLFLVEDWAGVDVQVVQQETTDLSPCG